MSIGRNDPCPCGSGQKFKKCCLGKSGNPATGTTRGVAVAGLPPRGTAAMAAEYNQLVALFNGGRYPELEERARSMTARYPDFGLAWKVLGVARRVLGKESLSALAKAAELLPDDVEAHNNLGAALLDAGQPERAGGCHRRALQVRPDDADAFYHLGNVLHRLGRGDEAADSYRQALRLNPAYAEAHGNLGNVLLEQGRVTGAEDSYRQALRLKPDYAVAHFNLGSLLQDLGRLTEAEASYRRALQSRPEWDAVYLNLGSLLLDVGRTDEAATSYRCALHLKPDCAEAHASLGNALMEQGRLDEAEASCRRALGIAPDLADAHCNLGNIFNEQGRLDEAEACYRRALRSDPSLATAHLRLASVRKTTAGDADMAALVALEAGARHRARPLPNKDAACLHFALGKRFDDLGDPASAFPHFLEGNRLKRATVDYDPERVARYFDTLMRNLDGAAVERLRGGGDPSSLPIFVLGMPRSGTTLTEQIIASHPAVHGAGELPDLGAILRREVAGAAFPDNLPALDRDRLSAWGADYVAGLQQRAAGARRITDKMPANFLALGLIHLMLPNAKVIHVGRDPADTCFSCFTTLFNHGQHHTYDLAEIGRYYAAYARLMDHWRKVLPGDAFLDVRYEDIVADQEAQARRLIGFCGLEWDDACLDFHRNTRTVRTASMSQVRQPIYRSSLERWRPYEAFLTPLFDALGDLAPGR